MFHFAAAITQKAITEPGEFFKCFPPFGDDPLLYPQNARLYGVLLEVSSDVSTDFDIDVKWNGDTIFVGAPPTFAASSNIQFIMLDIDAPDTAGPILPLIFEEITIELLEVPVGGIPAGMKVVVIFDDGDDGGVTDHGALTGLADDDHPQYQLRDERNAANGYAGLDGTGLIPDNRIPASIARDSEVTAAIGAHESASDPHPQYLRQAEADLLYEPLGGGGGGGGGSAFTWRGAWSGATAYVADDVVSYGGSSFIAVAGSTNVAPGTDATKWSIMSQKGDAGPQGPAGAAGAQGPAGAQGAQGAAGQSLNWRNVWSSSATYAAYDAITYNGTSYIAVAASTNVIPGTDATKWNILSSRGSTGATGAAGQGYTWRGAWSSATAYAAYNSVYYNGSSYVALAASTNVIPGTDVTKWSIMSQKGADGAAGTSGSAETDFISGLELSKTGNQTVTISPGAAYIPSLGRIVRLAAATAISPGASVAAGRWYFYLYEDGAGNAAIEASQTAPIFYAGDAQHKAGDNSRRFFGYALSDGTAWWDFKSQAYGGRADITWEAAGYDASGIWALVVAGASQNDGGTALSIAGVAPPGIAILNLLARMFANATSQIFYGINGRAIPPNSSPAGYWGSEVLLEHWNPTDTANVEKITPVSVHVDRSGTNIYYRYTPNTGNGSISIYVRGLTYRR